MGDAARQAELDGYEERFGKYVQEHGPFGMMGLKIGNQGFPIAWNDDPEFTAEQNAEGRRWFKRMLCNALHVLVENETATREPNDG